MKKIKPLAPIPLHVDLFIANFDTDPYASWFLMLARLPACLKIKFDKQISRYQLYCQYKGRVYRCTGASRLGDVWLNEDFTQSIGYDLRVDVARCSLWNALPFTAKKEKKK